MTEWELFSRYNYFKLADKERRAFDRWQSNAAVTASLFALALLAMYALLLDYLGYLLSTALFLFLYLRIFGSYRWAPILIGSIVAAVASAYLWTNVGLMLPGGISPWPSALRPARSKRARSSSCGSR